MNKSSYISISNKTNILSSKIFHIYRNGKNCKSKISFFLKSSVKKLKSSKKIEFKKKKKIFSIFIRSKQWILREDGSQRKFFDNSVLVLKKNSNLWSNYVWGPTTIEVKRKKYLSFFSDIF
jgi:ribosomal protein L14